MDHIAIDLGAMESQICRRDSDGKIVDERRLSRKALGGYLEKAPPSRVIVETCAEAFEVADAALACGHQVRVVPATLAPTLGVGARGVKTDRRDAQALSEVSCRIDLPSVHVPSQDSRRRKTMCGMREALVQSRTQLVNTVRGWLRTQGRHLKGGSVKTLTLRVRRVYATPPAIDLPSYVNRQLDTIDQLSVQIAEADAELATLAANDPNCRRLMTAPGVGPVTAVRFVAAVDDISRFATAHQLESYLGLTPGENSSSERRRRTGITKAGPTALRWALVQAAWAARRCRVRGRLQDWANEIEKRRGRRIAVIALARKLSGILFAMWRDQTNFRQDRLVSSATPT